jgi:dipeptidase E
MRRSILVVLTLLALCPGSTAFERRRGDQDAQTPKKRLIFADGGWGPVKDALPLMRYFISLTGKPNPKVCLLPTASGDSAESIVTFYDVMNQLECRPRHLRLFQPSRVGNFEEYLMDMDAIYVGGGNTLNMLAIWKGQGIDKVLRKAYEKGIVLGGGSAGAICWFTQGCTDSRPGKLTALEGLGWLSGSTCPHFNLEKRQTAYHELILAGDLGDGIACDEGVGVLFEDEKISRIVSSLPKARAYAVRRSNGKIESTALETEYLGK